MKDISRKNKGYRLQATDYRLQQATGYKEACSLQLVACDLRPATCDLRPATDKGFTLIEVMIAIAIIAIALVVILHSYGLGISMANESQDFSLATLLAQKKMNEVELGGYPAVGQESGDFGEEYSSGSETLLGRRPGFTWQVTVAETPIEDLRKVTLIISWAEKNLEVITYLAERE